MLSSAIKVGLAVRVHVYRHTCIPIFALFPWVGMDIADVCYMLYYIQYCLV